MLDVVFKMIASHFFEQISLCCNINICRRFAPPSICWWFEQWWGIDIKEFLKKKIKKRYLLMIQHPFLLRLSILSLFNSLVWSFLDTFSCYDLNSDIFNRQDWTIINLLESFSFFLLFPKMTFMESVVIMISLHVCFRNVKI